MPEPLPIAAILSRAARLAVHPVALAWMLVHVLFFPLSLFLARTAFLPIQWPFLAQFAYLTFWLLFALTLLGTSSSGLALVALRLDAREPVLVGECARVLASRAGPILRASVVHAVYMLVGLCALGVGAIWVAGERCAIVPACACEGRLSGADAEAFGRDLLVGHRIRAVAMFAIVTSLVIVIAVGGTWLVRYLDTTIFAGLWDRRTVALLWGGVPTAALCVYALVGAATYAELRGRQPTGEEIARTFA